MTTPGQPTHPAGSGEHRALRWHELAFNAMTDMVSVLGADGVYRRVNNAWCRNIGCRREDAVGHRVVDLLGVDEQHLAAVSECLAHDAPVVVRGVLDLPRLHGRQFESTFSPFGEDEAGVRCVVIVTHDITADVANQKALADSLAALRHTLEATGDAILVIDGDDPDKPVRFVNQRALQMWGVALPSDGRLTSAQILDHIGPLLVDAQQVRERTLETITQRLSRDDQITLLDGRIILRRCVSSPLGEAPMRVWSFRDITAETQAMQRVRDSEAEMRAMLDAFPGLIAVLDEALVYRFVNDRFSAILGRATSDVIGRSVDEVLGVERGRAVRKLAALSLHGEPVVFDRRVGEFTVQVTMAGGIDSMTGRPRYYGFGIDISDRRRAEESLIAARNEAERANGAKSQFLSHMSHELRTPLNAVLGFAQLLRDDQEHPLTTRQRGQTEEIMRGARHLLELINDVLDLSRVASGKLTVECTPMSLLPVVLECLHLVEPLAQQRGIAVPTVAEKAFAHEVVVDAVRLKQVLLNLLGNAIKFNQPGGELALHCRPEGERVRVFVHDRGPGLTPAQQQRLFTPFERGDAEASGIAGTGIGLALSRRLMHAMGGEIGVQSRSGGGCSFWIDLPRVHADVDAEAARAPATASGASAVKRVLYIEDNAVNVALMEAMLTRLGSVQVHCELHPHDGLAHARRELPDLILLDIQLPDMNGYEVMRQLREDAATRAIPVIAVSANAMASDIESGLSAGFIDYVTKPLELRGLLAAVRKALDMPEGSP